MTGDGFVHVCLRCVPRPIEFDSYEERRLHFALAHGSIPREIPKASSYAPDVGYAE